MDDSVYATGLRSNVAATLIERKRRKRRGSRVDETDERTAVEFDFLYLQIIIYEVVVEMYLLLL